MISEENKEIRENYRCDRFLLRALIGNKDIIHDLFSVPKGREINII